MMVKYEGTRLGDRLSVYAGNGQCEDDPRGREITVSFEFGLPTGEFDAPKFLYDQPTRMWGDRPGPRIGTRPNPDYREYGSWGIWIHVWRWVFRVAVRGPVLGHYPPDEDKLTFDEAAR